MPNDTHLRVRISDCDRLDHVNNAEYVNYLFQATAEAVGYDDFQRLSLRSLIVDYRKPARFGQSLDVRSWLAADGTAAYQVLLENGDLLVQAQAKWGLLAGGDHPLGRAAPAGEPPFHSKPAWRRPDSEGKRFRWRRDVQLHDLQGSFAQGVSLLRPTSLIRWVEEAIWLSSAKCGWPIERMAQADSLVLMTQHDLGIFADVALGQLLAIHSRIHELRKIRGTWRVDFLDDAQRPIATDYATGAFINRAGALAPPPAGLFDACLLGEPERTKT